MEDNRLHRLDKTIENGYDFNAIGYISRGWSLYTKSIGSYIGFFLCMILISGMTQIIPIIGPFLQSFVLAPCLTAGWFIYSYKLDNNDNPKFDHFFKGFDKIGDLILANLIMFGLIFVLLVFFVMGVIGFLGVDFDNLENFDRFETIPWGLITYVILGILAILFISLFFMWIVPLVVLFNAKPMDAVSYSRKLVGANIGGHIGFFLLLLFVMMIFLVLLGIAAAINTVVSITLAVIIGLFSFIFLLPVYYVIMYVAFEDITKLNEAHEDDTLDHLVGDDFLDREF